MGVQLNSPNCWQGQIECTRYSTKMSVWLWSLRLTEYHNARGLSDTIQILPEHMRILERSCTSHNIKVEVSCHKPYLRIKTMPVLLFSVTPGYRRIEEDYVGGDFVNHFKSEDHQNKINKWVNKNQAISLQYGPWKQWNRPGKASRVFLLWCAPGRRWWCIDTEEP